MKIGYVISLTAMLIFAGIGEVSACRGNEVIYQDRFEPGDSSWGRHAWMKFERGKLVVTADPGSNLAIQNQSLFFDDYDVCVDVAQRLGNATGGYAGLLFWGTDAGNYYTFDVSIYGHIRVSRLQNNAWVVPLPWVRARAVSSGTSVNTLRVRTLGNRITVYVNGVEAASLQGHPPSGGSRVGLLSVSPGAAQGMFEFDNFTVTKTRR